MTTPSAPAFHLADTVVVPITEDTTDITEDHTATNAVAAGADAAAEAGEDAEDTGAVANAAPTPGPPTTAAATST